MKIQIMSDIHNEFNLYQPPEVDADVVVLAGDIDIEGRSITWAKDTFADKPVVYVLGNHEYYNSASPTILEKLKNEAEGSQVHVLENEHIKMAGVNFLGCTLWTDFKLFGDKQMAVNHAKQHMNDYQNIRVDPDFRYLTPTDTLLMHKQSLHWLTEKFKELRNERIVIVTHHAPSLNSVAVAERGNLLRAAYASNLDAVVEESGAELWIHGHTHLTRDYIIGDTRVLCNPRGYPSQKLTGFYPGLVIEI